MFRNKKSGGFVFAEFAIALPLLILLGYGLSIVGVQLFYWGKIQLADYVLEEEVQEVLSRIIYDARSAKNFEGFNGNTTTMNFTYRTINELKTKNGGREVEDVIADKEEHRVYVLSASKIYYERQPKIAVNPITGNNYFGETQVNNFEFKLDEDKKLLHITLEMESLISHHKIKIRTAVYMSGCENFTVP